MLTSQSSLLSKRYLLLLPSRLPSSLGVLRKIVSRTPWKNSPHPPQAFKYQLESLLQSSAADKSSKIASSVNTKDPFDIANHQDVLLSDCYLVSTVFFLFALETVKGELTVCCNQPGQGAFGIHSAALLKRCCGVIEIKSGTVFRCWRIN